MDIRFFRGPRVSGSAAGGLAVVMTLAATAAPPAPHKAITRYGGELFSISAVSPADAWSAGPSTGRSPLLVHWNGTAWTRTPMSGKGVPDLNAVSADSATDAWAVGDINAGSLAVKDLALHWNGTKWTTVTVPSPGKAPVLDSLTGVSADSPGDAWAIGSGGSYHSRQNPGLIMHWNGTAWTQVAVPHAARDELFAVKALSPSDVWAFGQSAAGRILILHWNGTAWTQATASGPGGVLQGVTALSPTDIWAVGYSNGSQTLVLHWNGTSWTRQPSPSPGPSGPAKINRLTGVTALSDTDAWAVGYYGHFTAQNMVTKTLVLHWNGTAWTQVASPSVTSASDLDDVQALSSTDAWAVGGTIPAKSYGTTVVLHWNGKTWTRA